MKVQIVKALFVLLAVLPVSVAMSVRRVMEAVVGGAHLTEGGASSGASALNVFECLNPSSSEQSSTPGAHVAAVRIYDVRGPSVVASGNVTHTNCGFRLGSDEVDLPSLHWHTAHKWLGAYSESSDDGVKATMRYVVMPDKRDLSLFSFQIVTEFFGTAPHEDYRRKQLGCRLDWVREHYTS